ncbi:hypothetical protein RCL_jg19724.t1 [Rhizophagus clarus]|uniref:Uncharacterized protein n=1 Tax=Rhizophagus clarus TaxID=94130 RepID=A0A8H3MAS4_9GLOM|nr:hypothetical protein RCL_jg19724.t1 [Rhizophagus clarus]
MYLQGTLYSNISSRTGTTIHLNERILSIYSIATNLSFTSSSSTFLIKLQLTLYERLDEIQASNFFHKKNEVLLMERFHHR